jgi:aerobic-type carbon monoxide dehydrogenase small subunit (CoxS/CutS family)
MIMEGVALLERNPSPAELDIKEALDGNVCRCGTYSRILTAVLRAAEIMKRGQS